RRAAVAASDDLEKALFAWRGELDRVPPALRNLAATSQLPLVEAEAKAARAAISAGDFVAAARSARDGVSLLAKSHATFQKALGDAAEERDRRFGSELAAVEADEDLSLAATLHLHVVAMGAAARKRLAGRELPEAIAELDRALDSLRAL